MIDLHNPDFTNTPASRRRPVYGYRPAKTDAEPEVSLISPFFNTGVIFEETALSVMRQSLQQWEWIIVDDRSDDPESISLLRHYAKADPRIRVIRTDSRGGPGAARNTGVKAARSAWIAFLDSDDLLEPTTLEKWRWFLESHPQYSMVKGYQAGFGAQQYIWRDGFHSGPIVLERNPIQTASMMRRDLYLFVGGMDESIRGGMEDWDFWLRCADSGHWGGTIPEVLDWYRRRPAHNDQWQDWDNGERQAIFREELRRRYPRLYAAGFPQPELSFPMPYSAIAEEQPVRNLLAKPDGVRRLLLLVPHLVLGGSDKFNLDLIAQLVERHNFQVTVAATLPSTHDWRHRFEGITPDVFTLDTLVGLRDYPRFLSYLIQSRNIDSILVTHSQIGYQLLPYLRMRFPHLRCCDYVHIEELGWKEGGYPAYSLAYGAFLDQTIASSNHLKNWLQQRGKGGAISVVTTNIDAEDWSRDRFDADSIRRKWELPEGVPVILFAGRLCDQKQPHVLAAVIRDLRKMGLAFLCLVAGDGESGPWLRSFIDTHALREMRLLGSRSSDEIREILAVSDIFFLPSRHEGIALSIFEAMAMSAVVVGADVGGQKELVTPDCGILISRDQDEAEKYTAALASLLTDSGRRQAMAEAARKRVADHYTLSEMGERMAELLRSDGLPVTFDIGAAFTAFAPGFAREIIEQRRVEWIADQLWSQRSSSSIPILADPVLLADPAVLSNGSLPIRSNLLERLYRSVALLRPLCVGGSHNEDRRLLFAILRHTEARRELLKSFDRSFYCCSNPDVPSFGALPLLHYSFFGYREGRRPSPDFDKSSSGPAHALQTDARINPLLRKIVLAHRGGSELASQA